MKNMKRKILATFLALGMVFGTLALFAQTALALPGTAPVVYDAADNIYRLGFQPDW